MTEPPVDFIIVGAGSAGSALAARLTESGRHSVLLLEAGQDDRWPWIRIPIGVAKIFVGERALWRFQTEPEGGLDGRSLFFPRGRVLGGTSNVNGMFWVRGDPAEFDAWCEMGNPGWSYHDVLPLFRRMERYPAGDAAVRGRTGPLSITEYSPRDPLTDAFLRACSEAGVPENADYNGSRYEGAGLMQLSTRRGLRWSVREGYLRPAMRRRNLRVVTGALAQRVVLSGARATGVEYRVPDGPACHARAAREVIICAGTVQSPQLLELSGIGDDAVLGRAGIALRHRLPGVGEGLRDHLHGRLMARVRDLKTLNTLLPSTWDRLKMGLRYALLRDGLMSAPGATAHAFVRTRPGPGSPDIKLQLHHLSSENERDPRRLVLDPFPGFSIGIVHQQPQSVGSIHVRSPDAQDAPAIHANYLSNPEDAQAYLRGFRFARHVLRQPALARYLVGETRPGESVASDDELLAYIRANLFSSYHPVGTCRMGGDSRAVVDAMLRVHGIDGLRVADASIMPTIPASNTNAASIMIGEKAADLVLQSAAAVDR